MRTKGWYGRAAAENPAYRRQLARDLLAHRTLPPYAQPGAPGHVVEFLKAGKHTCGVLLRKGRRMHDVLDVNGKEDYVDIEKIVDVSSAFIDLDRPRHGIVHALRAMDHEREQLKSSIDPFELWEVAESESREWTLEELAALYFPGGPGPHGKAALFRALEGERAFRRQGQSFVPLKPERVAERRAEHERAAEADAWLHEAASWLRRVADGEKLPPPPNASRALELLAAKALFGADHPNVQQASALAGLAHFHSRQAIFETLVKAGYWTKDENLDLLRQRVPMVFDEQTVAEAETADGSEASRGASRLWLRKVYSFTGGQGCHERAISIRPGLFGFTVGVHFASPALLVKLDGLVQQAAAERAAGLHLPDRLIPMLPLAIADKAALTERNLKPSLTLQLRFDSRFQLRAHHFEICRVRVNCPLSPEEAKLRAEQDWGLRKLLGLAGHLRQQRIAAGAVILLEPEVDVRVTDGEIKLHRFEPEDPAPLIEQELSILAETLAGRLCVEHRLPAIYRAEEPCREVFVAPGRYDPVACFHQERAMPKAMLQTEPAAHHGLGAEVCVPISQPYSRYTDLLAHQQVLAFLASGKPAASMEDLKKALLYTASARSSAREIGTASKRYWLLRFLESKVGGEEDAILLERRGSGYLVELTETRLRAFCPREGNVYLAEGTRVRVRLTKVSARENSVRMQLVGER